MRSISARPVSAGRRIAPVGLLAVLATVAALADARAATVVLRISVVNPLDREQSREVRSNLPLGIQPDDILDLDGLDLRYDVAGDRYYVYRMVNLTPKQRIDYRVEMRDIWIVPEDDIAAFAGQAERLAGLLRGTRFAELAGELAGDIRTELETVRREQARHAIAAGARAADHIRAYYSNLAILEDVRDRVGQLENLTLGAGLDPGRLIGVPAAAPPLAGAEAEKTSDREAVIVITVSNSSREHPRTLDLRRDLPRELRPRDVLDPDGLEVGIDPAREVIYLFKEGLELAPEETRVFRVSIRDPWNVHAGRIEALRAAAVELLARVRGLKDYPSVEELVETTIAELDGLRDEPAPPEVNDRYVAHFRALDGRLDEVSRRLGRIETALRPGRKSRDLGFDMQPPDPKTTWLIIYAILGFMGALSLLFFLRWYGAGKGAGRSRTDNDEGQGA